MLKHLIYIYMLFSLLSCGEKKTSQEKVSIDTIPMLVLQIQKCSRLYSTEVHVHKIITHDDTKTIKGSFLGKSINIELPMADRKVAIPMDVKLKAYVDFDSFSSDNIKKDGEKIEIILPDPKIVLTSSKINHKDIRQYVSMIRSDFTDEELSAYEKQGRQAIINDIPKMKIIDKARINTAKTLIPMIEQMGYAEKDITISFRKQFTLADIPQLIETSSVEKRTDNP